MSDELKIIDYLREGKKVALWGASNDAIAIINALRKNGCQPNVLIDSDVNKQGKIFMGIPIISAMQALEDYQELYLYVVPSNYKFQVIGNLVDYLKFPAERIINYEPVVRKKGCMFIENALQCVGNSICFCSSDFGKKQSPRVYFEKDYDTTVDKWLQLRDEVSAALEAEEECSCSGCICVKEDWYAASPKIHIMNYSEGGVCNFKCVYCNAAAKTSREISDSEIDLADTLNTLQSKDMLAHDLHIDYSPGEPALHSKREKYYDSFSGKYTTLIMTNASVYDAGIEKALAMGKASLCVSVDSGTTESFHRVKGLDMFDRVSNNLQKYGEAAEGSVGLKYIFLPNENDNDADIEGFVDLCKKVNPAIVLLSYDIFHPIQTLTKQTYDMVLKMISLLEGEGIVWKNVSDVIARAFAGNVI